MCVFVNATIGSSPEEIVQVHLPFPDLLVLQPGPGVLPAHPARADGGPDALPGGGQAAAHAEGGSRRSGVGCGQTAGDAGAIDQGQPEHGSCVRQCRQDELGRYRCRPERGRSALRGATRSRRKEKEDSECVEEEKA